MAARITDLYREHGYILARAYVPAQEMRDGAVEIGVVEGRVGKIVSQAEGVPGAHIDDRGALWLVRLSYAIPVDTLGTKVGAAYTHSHVGTDIGVVVGDITVRGDADIGSPFVLHPFLRSRELSVYGQAGFDIKNFDNNFESQPPSQPQHDNLRVFSAGSYVDFVDRLRGANTLSLTLWQGVGNFPGSMDGINDPAASVPGAGGTFTKLTGDRAESFPTLRPCAWLPSGSRAPRRGAGGPTRSRG